MSEDKQNKSFPRFKTDEEAELFIEKSELSEYDFSDFKPVNFDFQPSEKSPKKPEKK